MITRIKNTGRFLKLETTRYFNDIKTGYDAGYIQYREAAQKNPVTDAFVYSKSIGKNIYSNMKAHRNLLTGPICVAGILLPFGAIWAPAALILIRYLRKLFK